MNEQILSVRIMQNSFIYEFRLMYGSNNEAFIFIKHTIAKKAVVWQPFLLYSIGNCSLATGHRSKKINGVVCSDKYSPPAAFLL